MQGEVCAYMNIRLRGFLVVFDLAQIVNLIWISIKTRYVCLRIPEEYRLADTCGCKACLAEHPEISVNGLSRLISSMLSTSTFSTVLSIRGLTHTCRFQLQL